MALDDRICEGLSEVCFCFRLFGTELCVQHVEVCIVVFCRFKNTLPFMVASTLDTFLRVTSPTLFATYGRKLFFTTLNVIKERVCPKLDNSTGKLKIEAKRLEEFLHCALTSATNESAEPVFKEL